MSFDIRPYHPSDLYMLYRICLLTGDSGKDASAMYRDPELLGHVYAAPYAHFEPDLCFILTRDNAPIGYVLGTRDSTQFFARCEAEWYPQLRQRYPKPADDDTSPDASMIRSIHTIKSVFAEREPYPAHLHIDLLPAGQGQGQGRRMMQTFLNRLRELRISGVSLGVGRRNTGAIGFYERMGFHRAAEHEWGFVFGMWLDK
jgi:ribosomal protein S18 acetylase RimI-like enzyme